MTEKRFEIIRSAIIDGARVIKDNEKKYTFATTFETATLINYRKALNELNDENEQLKIFLEALKEELSLANRDNDALEKENEQLKSELVEIKRQEQEVIEYLRAYHNGDVNELKKELKSE